MTGAPHLLVSGVVLGQPMGGVRRHNQELLPRLARGLARRGGSLTVLEGRVPLAIELPPEALILRSRVPAGPAPWRAWHEARALRAAIETARAAGRGFDLVHTAHLPVPRALPLPFTWTIHDLRALDPALSSGPRRALARRVIAAACRRAALIFTVSEHVRGALVEQVGADARRIVVIGNGVDHLSPLPRRLAQDAPLVCVGHVEPRKNLAVVLRALAFDPALPRLEVAGAAKGRERERLEALARRLGIADRVRFLGPFRDHELPALYARAACVVVPSHVEGFGLSALEAAYAGAPVCVADRGSLPEIVPRAPRFDPDSGPACAAAIHAACAASEEDRVAQARSAGYRTWDAAARAWLDAVADARSEMIVRPRP